MMQVENEYGSYGEDKAYLRTIRRLMEERGVTCPLSLLQTDLGGLPLQAGTLIDDDVFVTEISAPRQITILPRCRNSLTKHGKK